GALEDALHSIREAAAATPADAPGIGRVEGWAENLDTFVRLAAGLREAQRSEAPDRFVERLRTGLLFEVSEAARPLGAYRLANLDRFFRDLATALERGRGGGSAVVASLRAAVTDAREQEEGRPRDAENDAVRVLTVHAAKGLEFEHVYLLQLDKGSGGERTTDTRVARRGAALAFRLFGQGSLDLPAVDADAERVAQAERVRTLYVAMTRAKRRLVLSGRPESRSPGSHVAILAGRSGGRGDLASWMAELAAADP